THSNGAAPSTGSSRVFSAGSWSVTTLLIAIWAMVAIGFAARLLYGAWSVRRIVRRSRPLEHADWQTPLYEIADRLELEAAPRLLRSDDVKMPFASGLLSSTIVLPAESDGWSTERRSAVLIHELGHVRRRDLVGHTLSRIACAVFWFHPLVWTAARRLRAESERACDDLALVFGARPSEYAEHLLDIVTCVRDHNTPAVALAMAHRREFEGRMLAILNPELRRRGPSRLETAAVVGSLAVLALFVGAAAPVPRSPQTQTDSLPSQTATHATADSAIYALADSAIHAIANGAIRQPVASPEAPSQAHRAAAPAQGAQPEPTPTPSPLPMAQPQVVANVSGGAVPQNDDERAAVLAKTLRTDTNAGVRRVAAWGLHRYANVDVALDALVAAVQTDADAEVREMAAWALAGARHSSSAGAALAKAIRQDKDASVRRSAAWAAGSIGADEALDAIVATLGDSDAEVRELAAWAIGTCHPEQAPAGLVRALSDKERDVRLSVAWALFRIADEKTASAIDAAFQHEPDTEVQQGLIRALGAMGDLSIDALQRLVTSPDSEVRTLAVTALAGGKATGPWPWPRPEPRPFP
ncbi:MAG: HEAT repeat domain-containing protein, partial [Gemmatimonadota bacterium]